MRTFKHYVTALFMLLCSVAVSAQDFEVGGVYYNITSEVNKTVAVTYKGTSSYSSSYPSSVVIPETVVYNDVTYNVTSIGSQAFRNCSKLTSIEIPNTISSIESSAFENCNKLTSIEIPSSVTSFGYNAFSGCSALNEVHISDLAAWCGINYGGNYGNPLACAHNLYLNGELVTELVIPEGVTKLYRYAFYGCTSITSVTIPSSVTSFDYDAFSGCVNISSISVAQGNAKFDSRNNCNAIIETQINKLLFGCKNTVIPEGITSIGDYAFRGCTGLTGIEIPSSVTSIQGSAFYNCSSLNQVHISDLAAWCNIAFGWGANPLESAHNLYMNGELVTELVIPEGVTNIRSYAFSGCTGLTSIEIPNSVTSIEYNAFSGCTGLTSIEIPNSVTSIGSYAFDGCSCLASVTIPEGVTRIENGVFRGCRGLTSIEIPNSVTSIGYNAFSGCTGLRTVTSNANVAPSLDGVAFDTDRDMVLNYPEGANYISWGKYFSNFSSGSCSNYDGQSEVNYVMDEEGRLYIEGTGVIRDYVFRGDLSVTAVYIDEGITEIADGAFCDCFNLKDLHLPETLTKIGNNAFENTGIKYVVIPNTVTNIGEYAFSGPTELHYNDELYHIPGTTMIFKSQVAPKIGYMSAGALVPEGAVGYGEYNYNTYNPYSESYLFEYEDELVVWGDSWNSDNTENIKEVYIFPEYDGSGYSYSYNVVSSIPNVERIHLLGNMMSDYYTIEGNISVFQGNSIVLGTASSVIPQGITCIGYSAFSGCTGLTSIVIPNSVTSIAWGAFQDCTGLTSVEIPNSVTSIGSSAFSGCTGLTSIEIGNSVTSIGSYAFSDCTSLTNISVAAGNVKYDSRNNCNAIIETASNKLLVAGRGTVIPSTVTAVASSAFVAAGMDIVVPSNVVSIETYAFSRASNVHFESTEPVAITGNIFGKGAIYVPAAAYETYLNADVWKDYSARIVTTEIADKCVEVEATEGMSGVLDAIGVAAVEKVVKLKVKGSINSYDIIVFRDKMPLLCELDLSEATVVASSKPFYQTYKTGNNSLGGYAFYDLDKLVSVKLPKDLKTLGDYAFYSCNKLKNVDATAAPGLEISANAFNSCNALEEILLPQNVAFIGSNAFNDCNALQSVEIGCVEGDIDTYAFQSCDKLSTVRIDSVGGSIKSRAFQSYSWDSGSNLQSVDIKIIDGDIEKYAFGSCSMLNNLNIESIGGDIENYAFSSCSMLKNVEIDSIGGGVEQYAFQKSGVETMYFGAVGRLDTYSLGGCPKLKSVIIGNGPATIPSRLFVNSHNIESFVVEEGVTEVADNAFYYSGYLTTNYYSEYVTSQLKALKRVKLPESVQRIGKHAFNECTALSDFNIPKGVTSIGSNAFYNCNSLKSVTIPAGVVDIAAYVFYSCDSLKSVTFPDSLVSIDYDAFNSCGSIEQIKLPPTVKSIGNNAFYYCRNLAELHIPSSVETIGNSAFSGCSKLNSVYTYTIEPTVITENTFSTFSTAKLYVPATSFWNYYWDIGWSKFNQKNFEEFNKPYDYFYLNNDYTLNDNTGYIEGTPDADLKPGSGLIVEGEEVEGEDPKQNLGDVDLEHNGDSVSSSIIAGGNLHIDNLFIKIKVNSGRWYFFAFPFDIKFKDIYMDNGSDYVFRYYDGDERAKKGNGGWKNVNESHLKAARGYIFQCAQSGVLILSIKDVKFKKEDKYNELIAHVTENMNDASWNFVGNPYLSYYDLADLNYTAPVTVWDGEKYVAIRPGDDDYHFSPYEAFFVQKPEDQDNIKYDNEEQMTNNQSKNKKEKQAAARRARGINPERLLINLVLGNDVTTDRTRVVFNAKQTHNYETACDAAKFETEGVPQIYTMDNEGVRYAINERPVGNGVVFIGYTADADGYYTIEAARMDTKVFLYDALTGEKHYFEDGAYRFYSDKGTYEKRFSLGVRGDEATGIEEITENELAAVVAAVDGGIKVDANVSATIYNAAGMLVAVQNGAGVVQLPAGAYIVCVGNNNTKVVVK